MHMLTRRQLLAPVIHFASPTRRLQQYGNGKCPSG